jgi:hypothetical protein
VAQKPMRHPIDEVGLAASRAFHQHKGITCRIRIILDPLLHVLVSRRTAKHDAGHCCSIGCASALVVTQIKVEQLFIGRLQRAFDPTARNRRFLEGVAAGTALLHFPARGASRRRVTADRTGSLCGIQEWHCLAHSNVTTSALTRIEIEGTALIRNAQPVKETLGSILPGLNFHPERLNRKRAAPERPLSIQRCSCFSKLYLSRLHIGLAGLARAVIWDDLVPSTIQSFRALHKNGK